MKHLLLSTLMILCAAAQSQNVQRVHQSNGTILQLPMSTIDSITYSTNAQSQTIMSIYQSNGSVIQLPASTIDSVTYLTINPGNLASLTTLSIGNITATSAVSGGSISADGGSPVTHRGVCWATTQNPTTANNVAVAGSGIGTFTVNLSGLAPNTTYYIRAYAINTKGTAYGNQLSFTTSASSGGGGTGSQFNNNLTYGTVTDIDGNIYKTIQIGSQIWIAENLRVTKYRDGVSIPNITDNVQWQNNTTGAWSYYNQNAINNLTYGKLYNWHAVKSSRNICPAGWHMPKDEEWTILETTLGSNSVAGGKMKSTGTNFWTNPNADATNSSGFSALPAGSRSNTGEFQNAREYGLWWSVTDFTAGGWMRFAEFTGGNLYRDQFNKNYGLSVRCVFGDIATATTNSVTDITPTSAVGGGNITDDGGATITARGVVWSTSPNPTIFLPTKTNDGTGSGSFTSIIEGLWPNTTYYVRVYATNIVGTTYGSQVVFITDNIPSISTNSVTDITDTSAISGGNIISDGGDPVTARGVVWSTNPNPTIDLDTKTNDGSGNGAYTSNISGLILNTTYYVRAYATNNAGTAYGNEITFTADNIPTIVTTAVSNILETSAVSGGNITYDGGDPVIARGVVWSTSPNPTIDLDTKTNDGDGRGTYSSNISGLTANTVYYVSAYATNSVGTAYGEHVTFIIGSQFNPNLTYGTMSDNDGNTYKTIQIGTQEWMAENLRTTKYRDGTNIPVVTDNTQWANNYNTGATAPMMCWYNNDQARNTAKKFGALYNWYAINPATNSNKNVCPTGWHVPTEAELNKLEKFLDPNADTTCQECNQSLIAGSMMKSTGTQYWLSPNNDATNSSGWSGLPGGYRSRTGTFYHVGFYGFWWSSTELDTFSARDRYLSHWSSFLPRTYGYVKADGFSVRCLRD